MFTCAWEALQSSVRKLQRLGRDNRRAAVWKSSSALEDNTQQTLAACTPRSIPCPCALCAPLRSTISAMLVSFKFDDEEEEE